MELLSESIRFVHVTFGAIGLTAFWVPVLTRKGAANHVRFGRIFVWSAYIVLGAAALALARRVVSLLGEGSGPSDAPILYALIVFLAYLTYVTFVIVRHGMGALRNKQNPAALRTTFNKGLAYGSVVASTLIILYALILSPPNKILLFALSPIGFATGSGILRYIKSESLSPREWMYEHLGAMLGAGIAFHTAFAVFGAGQLFDLGLTGWVAVIPWIAPAAIGIPATTIWTRHYRRKFGEMQTA